MWTSAIDAFITSDKRTAEGFFYVRNGLPQAISRGLAYAPYVDLLWCETGKPDLEEARTFAEAIHKEFPGKMLAYNCSPSFNWKRKLDDGTIARFQRELGRHGLQVPVHHAGRLSCPQLLDVRPGERLSRIANVGVCRPAGGGVQSGKRGYSATRHQREVGAGYFDDVTQTIVAGTSSITALSGSTEEEQFHEAAH